ncbi:hypothetical protein HQ533_03110 [Candidatus Woesearchaeota archaeon]|nr:hypothetical protein [Candidatus Woesearchaeota archaeon]
MIKKDDKTKKKMPRKRNEQGVIGAIIVFFIGVYFAIPSQANIGYMIVDTLAGATPTDSFLNLVPVFKAAFNLLGVAIVVADIMYIVEQVKKGNFL